MELTQEKLNELLTPENLVEYLEGSDNTHSVFGEDSCLLYEYLTQLGYDVVLVGLDYVQPRGRRVDMPVWYVEFVRSWIAKVVQVRFEPKYLPDLKAALFEQIT